MPPGPIITVPSAIKLPCGEKYKFPHIFHVLFVFDGVPAIKLPFFV